MGADPSSCASGRRSRAPPRRGARALGDREPRARLPSRPQHGRRGDGDVGSGCRQPDVVRTNVTESTVRSIQWREPGSNFWAHDKLLTRRDSGRALRAGGETFAVPMHAIRTIPGCDSGHERTGTAERITVEQEAAELVRLDRVLIYPLAVLRERRPRWSRRGRARPLAVAVGLFLAGVTSSLGALGGPPERRAPAGATVSGAGRVILLVDRRLAEAAKPRGRPARAAGARARGTRGAPALGAASPRGRPTSIQSSWARCREAGLSRHGQRRRWRRSGGSATQVDAGHH